MPQNTPTTTKKIAADILARLLALTDISTGYDYPRRDLPNDMPCVVVFFARDTNDLDTVQCYEINGSYTAMIYKRALNQEAWYEIQDLKDTIVDSIHSDRSLSGTLLHMFIDEATAFVSDNSQVGIEFAITTKRIKEYI